MCTIDLIAFYFYSEDISEAFEVWLHIIGHWSTLISLHDWCFSDIHSSFHEVKLPLQDEVSYLMNTLILDQSINRSSFICIYSTLKTLLCGIYTDF